MTYGPDTKAEFLKALEKTPFLGTAAKRAGLSVMTVHRWMKDDPHFKRAVESVRSVSRESVSEGAESVILQKIKEGDVGAAKFFLVHNSRFYSQKARDTEEKLPLMDKSDNYFDFGPGYQAEVDLEKLRRMFVGQDGKYRVRKKSLEKFMQEVLEYEARHSPLCDTDGNMIMSRKMAESMIESGDIAREDIIGEIPNDPQSPEWRNLNHIPPAARCGARTLALHAARSRPSGSRRFRYRSSGPRRKLTLDLAVTAIPRRLYRRRRHGVLHTLDVGYFPRSIGLLRQYDRDRI
jgi:hypothetical protein